MKLSNGSLSLSIYTFQLLFYTVMFLRWSKLVIDEFSFVPLKLAYNYRII